MIGMLGLLGVALIGGLLLDPFDGKSEEAQDGGDDIRAADEEESAPKTVLNETDDGEVERVPDLWEVDAAFAEGEGTEVFRLTEEDPTTDPVADLAVEEVAELPPGEPEAAGQLAGADITEEIRVIPQEEGVWIVGTSADELLEGTEEADAIFGEGGADTILGADGGDYLRGEDGDDRLEGGEGGDTLHGGRGMDLLTGDAGDDELYGHSGDDALVGGEGDDRLVGGEGDDSLSGGAGNDTLEGGLDNDRLDGGAGEDTLMGGSGDDTLFGGEDDVRDWLNGGAGDDTISLGAGDVATGSGGADVFVLASDTVALENEAEVTDFDPQRDKLEILHPADTSPALTTAEADGDTFVFADGAMVVRLSGVTDFDVGTVRLVPS